MLKTFLITIKGKVQGVYFRESTRQKATALGLTGTAENLSNGDVQIFVTGDETAINNLLEWCHKGPPDANVSEVIPEQILLQHYTTFTVKRSH